jgi:hypothetical protein
MLKAIRDVQSEPWNEITTGKLIATSLALFLFLIMLFRDSDKFIFLIDHANLAFHEAGHVIFGLLGGTLGLYGGTLGQLVFPLVAVIAFWLRREAISFAVAHDWTNIFSRWSVLSYDTRIASFVNTLGWLGMLGMGAWMVYRWHQNRE